jgi:hypothetical protein
MRHLLSLAFCLSVSGCFAIQTPQDQPPSPLLPTQSPTPSGTPTYRIALGAATFIAPGQQAGYSATANTGRSYRLVWTGDATNSGTYHEFSGSITVAGHFVSSTPGCTDGSCPLERDDWISAPYALDGGGERIDFDTYATTGVDGIDFVVDSDPVMFDVQIDGYDNAPLIFFTEAGTAATSNPTTIPFNLVSG